MTELPWGRFTTMAVCLLVGFVAGVQTGVWVAWRTGE